MFLKQIRHKNCYHVLVKNLQDIIIIIIYLLLLLLLLFFFLIFLFVIIYIYYYYYLTPSVTRTNPRLRYSRSTRMRRRGNINSEYWMWKCGPLHLWFSAQMAEWGSNAKCSWNIWLTSFQERTGNHMLWWSHG